MVALACLKYDKVISNYRIGLSDISPGPLLFCNYFKVEPALSLWTQTPPVFIPFCCPNFFKVEFDGNKITKPIETVVFNTLQRL